MRVSCTFSLLLMVLLFTGSLVGTSGCIAGKEQQNPALTPASTRSPSPQSVGTDGGTCASLGGDVCTAGQECRGAWITASDSISCCSLSCTIPTSSEILTIEPFDTLVEDDDLGDIV